MQPLGFIEVSSTGARWVPLEPSQAELALRILSFLAIMLPFGGRRGLLGRVLLLVIGQVAAGRLARPNLPAFDTFKFGRGAAGQG